MHERRYIAKRILFTTFITSFERLSEKRKMYLRRKELKVTIDTQINVFSLCESGAMHRKEKYAPSASRPIPYQNISLFMTNYYFPFFLFSPCMLCSFFGGRWRRRKRFFFHAFQHNLFPLFKMQERKRNEK